MFEHDPQSGVVGDQAGEVSEFAADAFELGVDAACGVPAGTAAAVPVPVEVFEEVQAGQGLLGVKFGGESGGGGAGVALEDGEAGVFVLQAAGDGPEGPVGDVPGEGAAELPCVERPGHAGSAMAVAARGFGVGRFGQAGGSRDERGVGGGEQVVEVVSELAQVHREAG
ncbi:hypothetical protein OG756_02125 [Streptomyces sp. NBC_01310]|uniref:hypothetical protein n=1 Tax=Streptomyces sp. NBC_01310 TaxID=2903820 RepID=UPI0035B5BB19|nr:hypothetical protein OG756_02125 [Streptomyces sp. NBC_01310]